MNDAAACLTTLVQYTPVAEPRSRWLTKYSSRRGLPFTSGWKLIAPSFSGFTGYY